MAPEESHIKQGIVFASASMPVLDLDHNIPCPLALAEAFILANLSKPVVAADIAAAAGMNVRTLQRLFRKRHAATPTQVLLNTRIVVAREIILRGDALSVRQIAAQMQFSNPNRFSKLYRKIHAHVPSEEIRQSRAGDLGFIPATQ